MAADDPVSKQFEILRKRARQAAQTAAQQEKQGLQRRFASIGQVGSGAQIRAEAQASERGAKRLQRAEESVGLAELAERQRRKEIGEQRAFQSGEREASQLFAAGQAGLGRQFAAQQAGIGRSFAAEQAGLGRQFAAGESAKGRQFSAAQAGIGRQFAAQQAGLGREFSAEQAGLQRAFQRQVQEAQQKFARGERLSSQEFAALEASRGREFATGERIGSEQFAANQASLGREFQEQQANLARFLQGRALSLQERAFNTQINQWDQEFARDSVTLDFNRRMAEQNANRTFLDDLGLGNLGSFQIPGTLGGSRGFEVRSPGGGGQFGGFIV